MNKILTIIAMTLLTVVSSQTLCAQTVEEEATLIAKQKVEKLSKQLDLTDKQVGAIYPVLYAKELNYQKHVVAKKVNSTVRKGKEKFDASYHEHLESILAEKQLTLYRKLYPVEESN